MQNMLDDYEAMNMMDFTVSTFTSAEALLEAFRYGDYALAAYEFNARQYFVKPVEPARLLMTLELIISGGKGSIVVKQGRALRKIMRSVILFCETQRK